MKAQQVLERARDKVQMHDFNSLLFKSIQAQTMKCLVEQSKIVTRLSLDCCFNSLMKWKMSIPNQLQRNDDIAVTEDCDCFVIILEETTSFIKEWIKFFQKPENYTKPPFSKTPQDVLIRVLKDISKKSVSFRFSKICFRKGLFW